MTDHDPDDPTNTNSPTTSSGKKPPRTRGAPLPGTVGALNTSYGQLIKEAILALKDRTGSSQPAITKWILSTYTDIQDGAAFRRNLSAALKTGIRKQQFEKFKASYKISPAFKAQERAKQKRLQKIAAATKKKRLLEQRNQEQRKEGEAEDTSTDSGSSNQNDATSNKKKKSHSSNNSNNKSKNGIEKEELSEEMIEKKRIEREKKAEAARRKAEAEAKAKERAERLRRRRFPMEDTKLHAEDKELGVKPPADVIPRPYLPYFWTLTVPLEEKYPARPGKTPSSILQASKVEGLDTGSHGLVPDLLQVYHFFRGDVHFSSPNQEKYHPIVPEFTLKHLVFAVEQVLNGNARKARLIPPLICHLFVTCLQILCMPPDASVTDKNELKLRNELHSHLAPALSPASWGDICSLYMDAMDRFFSTDASRDRNVLDGLAIDIEYLLGMTDNPIVPMTPAVTESNDIIREVANPLPDRYYGYLGDPKGTLYRAHTKLTRQDPWMLTAEELMSLLRALTDDILAFNKDIGDDIAAREESMQELLRAKRTADNKYRKVRLAFEGPKRPKKASEDKKTDDNNVENNNDKASDEADGKEDPPFKPTATRKEFESAKRAQQRADEAYEKGIRKLLCRTEPVGYDRNFNAVYCFRNDPDVLFIEDLRPSTGVSSPIPGESTFEKRSWHLIEATSLFDLYTSSLDIRGKREYDLYDAILGPPGSQQSLRRFLYDDVKEQTSANARLKEMEILKKKFEAARVKCDEEKGRRSGRLAGQAEMELLQLEQDMVNLEASMKSETKVPTVRNYSELTGIDILRRFEKTLDYEKRRSREAKISKEWFVPILNCTQLCCSGHIDGTGIIGMLISEILLVEELCESLIPWSRHSPTRTSWISSVESTVGAWNSIVPDLLGPPDTPRKPMSQVDMNTDMSPSALSKRTSVGSNGPESKKRRTESPATPTLVASVNNISSVISMLKQPLLDLEERAADITNLATASRDQDLADDNMSTDTAEDDQVEKEKLELAWKRLVHRIRETPTKRYVQIREQLVAAITAARKAHRSDVVTQLRAALLLYRPGAGGECKAAAIKVLEEHGDYDYADDDYDETVEDDKQDDAMAEDEEIPSVISFEAALLRWSDDFSRKEWIDAVKSVKTISRFAALCTSFCRTAKQKLQKIIEEQQALKDALVSWAKDTDRKNRKGAAKGRSNNESFEGPSEVWANVTITDDICMAKVEKYPWWPAKKCIPKDSEIAQALSDMKRSLVSLVGEMGGLRVVRDDQLKAFTGEAMKESDTGVDYSKDMRSQLNDCISMARRIQRGKKRPSTK